jgi:hypothetical protein
VLEGALLILGVAVGVGINRWWALGIAVPIGIWFALEFEGFENSSPPYWDFGLVIALVVAAAIGTGILFRRFLRQR